MSSSVCRSNNIKEGGSKERNEISTGGQFAFTARPRTASAGSNVTQMYLSSWVTNARETGRNVPVVPFIVTITAPHHQGAIEINGRVWFRTLKSLVDTLWWVKGGLGQRGVDVVGFLYRLVSMFNSVTESVPAKTTEWHRWMTWLGRITWPLRWPTQTSKILERMFVVSFPLHCAGGELLMYTSKRHFWHVWTHVQNVMNGWAIND